MLRTEAVGIVKLVWNEICSQQAHGMYMLESRGYLFLNIN